MPRWFSCCLSLLAAQLLWGYILICTFLTDILGARAAVASLMGYGISVPPAKEQSRSARARFIRGVSEI